MSSEWKKYRFSELCDISRGASPRPIKDYISDEGMPWVKIADATSIASRFITSTNEKIKTQGVSKSKTVFPGDLILSNSATPGLPKFMDIEACIHDGWMLLRNFQNLDKNFAYWLLLNERKNLVMQGNGSVFTNLKTDILKNHEVIIPDEDLQRVIASILDSIQEKIELNTQINKTLEEMAQAIFKSWFVDFDPVKARMAALASGGSVQDAELAAMSVISGKDEDVLAQFKQDDPDAYKELAETAALFPSTMQESELGEIPEGWEVKSLNHLVGFSSDKITVSDLTERNYISTENMLQNRGGVEMARSMPTVTTVPLFKVGDILISNIRPYFKKIWYATFNGGCSNDVLVFSPKTNEISEYIFHLLYRDHFFDFMMLTSKGAKMPRGDKSAIMNYLFVCSPNKLLIHYSRTINSFIYLNNKYVNQNEILSSIRDTLLPKLLTGEIDLSSIEKDSDGAIS